METETLHLPIKKKKTNSDQKVSEASIDNTQWAVLIGLSWPLNKSLLANMIKEWKMRKDNLGVRQPKLGLAVDSV